MSQFVLVANGVTNENFEKAIQVKIKSGDTVSFVPQAAQNQHGVTTQSMSSAKPANAREVLNSVRFEWDHSGEEFGAEIVRALAGYRKLGEQRHEPAA